MRKGLLCVVLGLLVSAPFKGWAAEAFLSGSGEASNAGRDTAISSTAELSAAITSDVSIELELQEVAAGQAAKATLAVSTITASTTQGGTTAASPDDEDDPAILVSLGAYSTLRVLSFFGTEQRRLLRETYIESERVLERMVRGTDSPWPLWDMVDQSPFAQPVARPEDQSFVRSSEPRQSIYSPDGAVPQAVF